MANAKVYEEGGFFFDYSSAICCERMDEVNHQGMSSVDFAIETDSHLLFVEFKNPDNPKAHEPERIIFLEKLRTSSDFPKEMAVKLKDSLLKWYASGKVFNPEKRVKYIFILELSVFGAKERGMLCERIVTCLPTGLTAFEKSPRFDKKVFEIMTIKQFSNRFGFTITRTE